MSASKRCGPLAPLLALAAACGSASEAPAPATSYANAGSPPGSAESAAWFRDATASWGVDFVHDAGFSEDKHLPETMGAGAALFDVEGDGDLDLYFVQSGPFPPRPGDPSNPPNQLFRAEAPGAFTDVTARTKDAAHTGYGMGVSAGDVDGDGTIDLFVTNFGRDVLLVQEGDLAFRDATGPALGDERWTAGSTFLDADRDGDLDLYVTGYVAIDVEDTIWCGRQEPGWRSYCHPDNYPGLADRYYENDGQGLFSDATEKAGLVGNDGKGLGALAGDFDGDDDLDLYIANDSVENRYWAGRGDGTFEDDTLLTGTGVNGRGATEAGMGLAAGDVDGDLDLDLFVTNFDEESNTLYRNDGGGLFTDITAAAGLDAPSRLPVGFGTVLEDFDGDGFLDAAVGNGHIIDNIHLYHDGKTFAQEALLFAGGPKGRFSAVPQLAGPLGVPAVTRGLYAGDLDGDGDADLVQTQCGGPARILENTAGGKNFFTLVLARDLPPAARITVRTSARAHLRSTAQAPSYFGSGSVTLRVALGPGETVQEIQLGLSGELDWNSPTGVGPGPYELGLEGQALALHAR